MVSDLKKPNIQTIGKISIMVTIFIVIVAVTQIQKGFSELSISDVYTDIENEIKIGTDSWKNQTINSTIESISESVLESGN